MDLRRKVVDAVLGGMPKTQAARTFGIGISTVKRYVSKAHKGEDLSPRRPPGRRRELDGVATRLLAEDLKEHPTATLLQRREYLDRVAGGCGLARPRSPERSSALGGAEKKIGGSR